MGLSQSVHTLMKVLQVFLLDPFSKRKENKREKDHS
jgi:hypothetical protein